MRVPICRRLIARLTAAAACSPADFLLDAITLSYASPAAEEHSRVRVDRLVAAWQSSIGSTDVSERAPAGASQQARLRSTSFFKAFPVIIKRSFTYARPAFSHPTRG